MPLEIICLEEHSVDAEIAKATRSVALEEAPYAGDVNSVYHDDSVKEPTDRPRFLDSKTAFRLAGEPVTDRLPAMDQAGIDMQIVSYSNATQDAPPAQCVSLAQAANDRLAEAVQKYPKRFGGFCTLPWQNPDAAVRETNAVYSNWAFAQAYSPVARARASFSKTSSLSPFSQSWRNWMRHSTFTLAPLSCRFSSPTMAV